MDKAEVEELLRRIVREELERAFAEHKRKPRKINGHAKEAEVLPEWVPTEQWMAYLEMRGKIKKPLTPFARDMALAKLERLRAEGHHPAAVLAQSVFSSYQGLFPVKEQ